MIKISGTSLDITTIQTNKEFFENNGIEIRIDTNKAHDNVIILIHEDILKRKIKRGGRYDKTTMNDLRIGEVFEMRKVMSDREIYESAGLSKPTFYRRLKKAQNFINDIGYDEAKDFHF